MNKIKSKLLSHKYIQSMAFVSLCTASVCISSFFVIPFPASASVLSLQTVFINLTALCLKKYQSFLAVALYLFMGIIGLPVFAGGTAGLSRLLSPVGGYYFGFLIAVFLMSSLKGKKADIKKYLAVTLFVGIPAEHIFAVIFMSITTSTALLPSFMSISLPFLAGDILKAVASAFIAVKLNKALEKI